ncbi:ABC transporter permease/substrate-binding protein [Tundrisphaera sp. TA3]|uniref:ABC transporter permease/substrate-binding protein n=1 Tax=Tundrisphaera sp. TA3 TaxID=3435775 RepID=UPI003EB77C7A
MNDWLTLLASERGNLAVATLAHLTLVGEALVIAVAIGVPLGVLASRSRGAERTILGLANVMQTIPALALLGVLLILFRGQIGKPPALAALVVYSFLPIIKNTILGLKGVDRGVAEAALGMGMTPWQRLSIVELPLAVPVLLGGVRVAAVAAVGMATIAATVGAEGLGNYIYRGISLSDPRLILLGSVPAALLALACDAALGALERRLDPTRSRGFSWRDGLARAVALGLLAAGLYGAIRDAIPQAGPAPIVIGSKDSAEPVILGHMMADLIEAHTSLRADRRLNLGGTLVCYNALARGGLDAYVEYTGTALTTILKEPPQTDPARVHARVASVLRDRDGIETFPSLGFENTFAILMRREQAERLGVATISDLIPHLAEIRPGFGPEFMSRPDGFPGLVKAYGLNFAHAPREMDRNLLYRAVAGGSLDLAAGDSTDGRVAALDLVQLVDDRRYFPPYEAVPLIRHATLERHPRLRDALGRLSGRIDAATMRGLNHQVDGLKRDPAQVAREFLDAAGLLKP